MPHRSNRKSDVGYTLPISDVIDQDNVFFTEEGWVYRHFKGNPNDVTAKYWDEILVAGQVDFADAENDPCQETVSANPRVNLGQKEPPLDTASVEFESVVIDTDSVNRDIIQVNDNIFDVEYSHDFDGNSNLPGPPDGGGGGGGGTLITEDQLVITVPTSQQPFNTNQYYPFKFELTGDTSAAYAFAFSTLGKVDPGKDFMIDGDTQYVFFNYAEDPDTDNNYVMFKVWYYTNAEKTEWDIVQKEVRLSVFENPENDPDAFWGSSSPDRIYFDGKSPQDYSKPYVIKNTPVEITHKPAVGTNFDPDVDETFSFTIGKSEDRATGNDYDPALEPVQQADGKWVFPEAGMYYISVYLSCGKISQPKVMTQRIEVHDS